MLARTYLFVPGNRPERFAKAFASGADRIVPVALAHAGWVAIELRRRLGKKIPAIVLVDWIVLDLPAGNAPDAIFLAEAFTRPKVMKYLAKSGFLFQASVGVDPGES